MQGGGASYPNFASQQHPVIKSVEKHCTPTMFRHVAWPDKNIRRWVSGYSDDIGLMLNEEGVKTNNPEELELPMTHRVRNVLNRNFERYEAYFNAAGGCLNLKKCFYYLVNFRWTGTAWRYETNDEIAVAKIAVTPTTLDNSGTLQAVTWMEPNDAQRTLGSFIAPDGSNFRQLEVLLSHLQSWKHCLSNINSSNFQARWLSFQNVFLRKILYPIIGHSCNEADLQQVQKPTDKELLHILGLNEHFPRAVLRAPLLYGGLGCASIHAQHVVDKLILFLHHIREGGQVSEALYISMGTTQLECGVETPFFSLEAATWHPLVTKTWISHIWQECQPKDIEIRFHRDLFWTPSAQREHDICIMTVAAQLYDGTDLFKINQCRIALKVTYLSDITSVDGKRILQAYYIGKGHSDAGRQSRLQWPPMGTLPRSHWILWREFLNRWCGTALRLTTPLGGWYASADKLTRICFCLHDRRLIMYYKSNYFEFLPISTRPRTQFHTQHQPFHEDISSHPVTLVDITYRNNNIYIVSQQTPVIIQEPTKPLCTSVQEMFSTMSEPLQRIVGQVEWPDDEGLLEIAQSIHDGSAIGVSDGSVRPRTDQATQAWIIQTRNGTEIRGKGPVDGTTASRTSHRAELQGQTALFLMIHLVAQYFNILGGCLHSFCDNQAVVKKLQRGWKMWRFRHTKGPDGDLQALLRRTVNSLESDCKILFDANWVQGHQDTKTVSPSLQQTTLTQDKDGNLQSDIVRRDSEAIPRNAHEASARPKRGTLSREATLNIRMDKAAAEAYDLPFMMQTQRFVPVSKAEGCAVFINQDKITSKIQLTALEQWHEREARSYLLTRHGISDEQFYNINWPSVRFALKKFSPHRRATAVKAIHRHLPTHDKLFQQGRIVMCSLCPRCLQADETNEHIYCCPQPEAVKQRKVDWRECWKKLHSMQTSVIIERTWRQHLQHLLHISSDESISDSLINTHGTTSVLLQLAIDDQDAIGWDKLLLGMGSRMWQLLQEHIDCANPKAPRRSATDWFNSAAHQLLKFSMRCWKFRNETIHGSTKQEQRTIALASARSKIAAIYANPPTLDPQFRSIKEVPLENRLCLNLQGAEQWLSLIAHQMKVTQHNLRALIKQHLPIPTHLTNMEQTARRQAIERMQPDTPCKAHRRAIQSANKQMREKLYQASSTKRNAKKKTRRTPRSRRLHGHTVQDSPTLQRTCTFPPLRHHPL